MGGDTGCDTRPGMGRLRSPPAGRVQQAERVRRGGTADLLVEALQLPQRHARGPPAQQPRQRCRRQEAGPRHSRPRPVAARRQAPAGCELSPRRGVTCAVRMRMSVVGGTARLSEVVAGEAVRIGRSGGARSVAGSAGESVSLASAGAASDVGLVGELVGFVRRGVEVRALDGRGLQIIAVAEEKFNGKQAARCSVLQCCEDGN